MSGSKFLCRRNQSWAYRRALKYSEGMTVFFSDRFSVSPESLEQHGALDISLVADLPLFIDPFLLFNSKNKIYRRLHDQIIHYMVFLRDKSREGKVSRALLEAWYCFPEVKQTWLGFSLEGNSGSGLGIDFAKALDANLEQLFPRFGKERITRGSHLEKVCLIREGVGRDNISDFVTNLIKGFLCNYTEDFARVQLRKNQVREVSVRGAHFNYDSETWEARKYLLPWIDDDFVLLSPKDILTRDENWINKNDLIRKFEAIPAAITDAQLRAQVSNYFQKVLPRHPRRAPTQKEYAEAARRTIIQFPALIDYYIKEKEDRGDDATSIASEKVKATEQFFVVQLKELRRLLGAETDFYTLSGGTYEEAHGRIAYLKDVIENKGGHRLFYRNGEPIGQERDLQIAYRLVWFGSPSDVTTEANDGRGPVDFKIARGAADKTLVEMKLARNTQLKRNLLRQTEIYQAASDAAQAIKVILFFSAEEEERVADILSELRLSDSRDIVLIDARSDNKPSGSRA